MGLKDRGGNRPELDAETLAALLENTLSEEERRRALDVLASSDADLEVLADAAFVLGDVSTDSQVPDDEVAAVAPVPQGGAGTDPARSFLDWKILLPLAAAIGGIVILPRLGRDAGPGGEWGDFEAIAVAIGGEVRPTLDAVGYQGASNPTRGADTVLSDDERSFRIGAGYAQVAVATAARTPEAASGAIDEVDALVGSLANGDLIATSRLIEADQTSSQVWDDLMMSAAALVPSPLYFELGLWVQRARISASLGSLDPANIRRTVARLDAIQSRFSETTGPVADALTRVGQLLSAGDLADAKVALDELASVSGG